MKKSAIEKPPKRHPNEKRRSPEGRRGHQQQRNRSGRGKASQGHGNPGNGHPQTYLKPKRRSARKRHEARRTLTIFSASYRKAQGSITAGGEVGTSGLPRTVFPEFGLFFLNPKNIGPVPGKTRPRARNLIGRDPSSSPRSSLDPTRFSRAFEGKLEFDAVQHKGWRGFELDWMAVRGEVTDGAVLAQGRGGGGDAGDE